MRVQKMRKFGVRQLAMAECRKCISHINNDLRPIRRNILCHFPSGFFPDGPCMAAIHHAPVVGTARPKRWARRQLQWWAMGLSKNFSQLGESNPRPSDRRLTWWHCATNPNWNASYTPFPSGDCGAIPSRQPTIRRSRVRLSLLREIPPSTHVWRWKRRFSKNNLTCLLSDIRFHTPGSRMRSDIIKISNQSLHLRGFPIVLSVKS